MDKNQMVAFSKDLQAAVHATMAKHGILMAKVGVGIDGAGNLTLKIAQPKVTASTGAQPTANAVARYKKLGATLGLPTLGAMLMVSGKEYALIGLSSDGSRVKALLNVPGSSVIDLPLAAVQASVAASGAKAVAQLDKAEQAIPDDVVDPDVTAFLAALGKKATTKPVDGGQ